MNKFSYLRNNHDLSLADWGPYSKQFFGLSHLADKPDGGRIDFSVIPGICGRALALPEVGVASNYLPWEVAADLDYYSYRQQIEWKDRVYCDISFSKIDENSRLMRCECVNNSELDVPFAIHLLSMLNYPHQQKVVMAADDKAKWIDAPGNSTITFSIPRIRDNQALDGLVRGEELDNSCMNGSCIGTGFGKDAGDKLTVTVPAEFRDRNSVVLMRCKIKAEELQQLRIKDAPIKVSGNDGWSTVQLFKGKLNEPSLSFVAEGGSEIKIDGFIFIPDGVNEKVCFDTIDFNTAVSTRPGPIINSRIMNFSNLDHSYALWWSIEENFIRHYSMPDMLKMLRYVPAVGHSFKPDSMFRHSNDEHAFDVVFQPVTVAAGCSTVIYAIISNAPADEIDKTFSSALCNNENAEQLYQQARRRKLCPEINSAGQEYLFSQERMMAVTMTNIVYPTRVRGRYVKHHTPGKFWNCLYSWDSGFIGMGLLEMDPERAVENLNVYMTEPGDNESAFIDHGTWVPSQIYLFQEIINRNPSREVAEFFYPRLKQFYHFFAGHATGSITRKQSKAGLISTFDYSYNSGGWDDYPPQWEIYLKGLKHIVPAISSVHAIRCAKLLKRIATRLDHNDDALIYENDIEVLTDALQQYSWDEEAGYFSYVVHNDNGEPQGFFKHASGVNYNMGLDGASPLISDSCTPEQKTILWDKLLSPEHCWSKYGLSTVDQSAPYFEHGGYWNGSVWMPYQWFFWKAALNDGRADVAWQIAKTGLDLWKRETEYSYCCYEHFDMSSGRGAGWHHFSALSVPVMLWFGAYFCKHRVTGGYDVDILELKHSEKSLEAQINIAGQAGEITTLITVLDCNKSWTAEYNGKNYPLKQRVPGTFEVTLPKASSGTLLICLPVAD
jgi:Mannosylglycerate hydrolase MGH1-like glycoside hydrolase domain